MGVLNHVKNGNGKPGNPALICTYLILPLIERDVWTPQHTNALQSLSGPFLAAFVEQFQHNWHQLGTDHGQMIDQILAQIDDHQLIPDMIRLLSRLTEPEQWQALLDERQLQDLKQRYEQPNADPPVAPPQPSPAQQHLRELLIAAISAAAGSAMTATAISGAQQTTAAPAAPPSTTPTPTPAPTDTPRISLVDSAPARIGPLTIPVTAAEWRAALATRDRVFGRHGLHQNPVPYWCYVPARTYPIGGWEKGDPIARIKLPEYWIARVPITVAQYHPFVAEGYRADARRFWTTNGWEWKIKEKRTQPWRWGEANSRQPQQPVVGVSWYEASAYCNWLAAQLTSNISSDLIMRLPTEAEWEAAAAFDRNGIRTSYPWGHEAPQPALADYDREWAAGPLPVGGRPRGAAACGAIDLVGTVWELTSSSYKAYPDQAATPVKGFTTNEYINSYRGGAYWHNSAYVRCGARNRFYPNDSSGDGGLRIVVAPRLNR